MNIVETVKKAAKAAKKKKMSKQDEKQIKDFEEREKAEKGYDEDARRYGMKESVFDARPKQKTEVKVMARTGHQGTQFSHEMRGRTLGPENPVNREFARIRIGDTELAKKEAAAKKPIKEEKEITSKVVKGVVHINGKPLDHGSVQVDNVDRRDYPDFADAYTVHAEFKDGTKLSDDEMEHLDHHHPEVAHEAAHESIRGGFDRLKEELIQILEARKERAKPKDEGGPCWTGYTQYGMKTKRGRSVPNCVKDK